MNIKKLTFNLMNIAFQKFDMNFLFLSLMIDRDIFQSRIIKTIIKTLIQFVVVYVKRSNKFIKRLKFLHVTNMT